MPARDPSDDGLDQVLRLERELLRPEVRRHPPRVRQLLHPEFREFGASGTVWTAERIAEQLATQDDGEVAAIEMHGPTAVALGPAAVLLTYTARAGDRSSLRSSIWVHDGDGWRLRFHQGTPR